ncbi:putative pectinesterase 63 isoform X1 [Cannabis sativa]|uniref:putative pectinesterase 63 isoform X1 n=1 Tax=Cannabis sativa TaxID=3483 RepID=UPI0029CA3579|nr:putative pectinesterase 63 isoform X1 [Cannabis sativa]
MALKVMFFIGGLVLALQVIGTCGSPSIIPADSSKLDSWIDHNMRAHEQGKNDHALDKVLADAEKASKVIKVRKDGSGDFKTITDAVKSIPSGNKGRVIVWIGPGVYHEHITVDRTKPFVTFYGDAAKVPVITFDGTAAKFGTWNSATVAIESNYFVAANIQFVNSSPMPKGNKSGEQAVALRISGDKAAFHNCKFVSYQDTLCDDKGRHVFKDCYIEGSVDFIFGNGQSLYLSTTIRSVAKNTGVITAQGRDSVTEDSGFTFVHCKIIADGDTYLGRAWREMPRVIFAYTDMGNHINGNGWSNAMGAPTKASGNNKCVYSIYTHIILWFLLLINSIYTDCFFVNAVLCFTESTSALDRELTPLDVPSIQRN